jgi:hypothetical protein
VTHRAGHGQLPRRIRLRGEPDPVGRANLPQQCRSADDRHHRVDLREIAEGAAFLVLEGNGLGDRQRLGDPRRLHEEVIKAVLVGQARDFPEQVLGERAADAAVRHLHELLFHAIERRLTAPERSVDVDLAHGVDDHRLGAVNGRSIPRRRALSGEVTWVTTVTCGPRCFDLPCVNPEFRRAATRVRGLDAQAAPAGFRWEAVGARQLDRSRAAMALRRDRRQIA